MRNMIRRSSEQRRASQDFRVPGNVNLDHRRSSVCPLTLDHRGAPVSPRLLDQRRASVAPILLDQTREPISSSSIERRRWSIAPSGSDQQRRGSISPHSPNVRTCPKYTFPERKVSRDVDRYKDSKGKKLTTKTVIFCVILMVFIFIIVVLVSYHKLTKLLL